MTWQRAVNFPADPKILSPENANSTARDRVGKLNLCLERVSHGFGNREMV